MPRSDRQDDRIQLLQGTLELLILRTLSWGALHGHGIAGAIQRESGNEFLVDHGSLYPALQRLERDGAVTAQWGESTTGRRARLYKLTPEGRRQLRRETTRWERILTAMRRVLKPADA